MKRLELRRKRPETEPSTARTVEVVTTLQTIHNPSKVQRATAAPAIDLCLNTQIKLPTDGECGQCREKLTCIEKRDWQRSTQLQSFLAAPDLNQNDSSEGSSGSPSSH